MTTPKLDEARLRELRKTCELMKQAGHDAANAPTSLEKANARRAETSMLRLLGQYVPHLLDALSAERERADRAVGRPVHVVRVEGADLEEWRKNVVRTETYKLGDTVLAWVNEGDLYANPACKFELPLATQKAEGAET